MGTLQRDSLTITILSYVGVAIGFLNKILLFPNFLSEEQVGLANILVSLAMMYAQFSALGINSTVVKFFPFFRTADRRHHGLFFWSALTISVGFLLFTTLFLLFRQPVMAYFARESPLLSQYYLLLIPLGFTTLFYNFFNSWLQALRRTVVSTLAYDVILRLLITLEISAFTLGWINFEEFVLIYVAIHFVPTLLLLLYTAWLRQASLRPAITPRTGRLAAVAGVYGLWQYFGGASLYLTTVIDQTMLAGIKGLVQGGIFSVMAYMVSAIMIPHRSMVKVSTPVIASLWKDRNLIKMKQMQREVSILNLILGCFIFLLIWINLDNIFTLMPASYAAGRMVFLFLGLGRIFEMYAGLSGAILVTSKRYRYDFAFSIFLVGMTIGSNALLIPRLGMIGAALATMITIVLYNALRIVLVWRFFSLHPFASRDLWVVGTMAGAGAMSTWLPYMGNFLIDIGIRTILIGGGFLVAIYLLKPSVEFNHLLEKILRKMRPKTHS